ncbi:MAG: hypothetical protein ABFC62_02625 [Clostridiaceae bacterium]
MSGERQSIKLSGAGTALLMMLFFVLCLTVLCALSLLSAAADLRLTKTYAASVQGYYEADAQATRVLCELTKANLSDPPAAPGGTEVALTKENGLYLARYRCGAGENQALYAEVLLDSAGRYRVLTWKLESTLTYSIDESIDVFDAASDQK